MSESTKIRWFEEINMRCDRCGGRAHGVLRGSRNESFGKHCKRCAEKRIKDSEKARNREAQK